MTIAVWRTITPDGMNPQYICDEHAAPLKLLPPPKLRTLDLAHGEANLECEQCDPEARRHNISRS